MISIREMFAQFELQTLLQLSPFNVNDPRVTKIIFRLHDQS